jgi:hypothetical protein
MKKSHGPDFRRRVIPLKTCAMCRGRAVVKGVFHDLDCIACNASGWVRQDNGAALDHQELVTQLSFNLRKVTQQLEQFVDMSQTVDAATAKHYEQNNRLGAGGTHYTGD